MRSRQACGPPPAVLRAPRFVSVLCFILLYKLGDMALARWWRPFWVDRHFSMLQIGAVPGTLGVVTTVLGALSRNLYEALGVIGPVAAGIAQAASNSPTRPSRLSASTTLMYVASVVESSAAAWGRPLLGLPHDICDKATPQRSMPSSAPSSPRRLAAPPCRVGLSNA